MARVEGVVDGKDIIYRNLNPHTSGTKDESCNDDALKEDVTLRECLKSASCDDDVEKEGTLKRSYRQRINESHQTYLHRF